MRDDRRLVCGHWTMTEREELAWEREVDRLMTAQGYGIGMDGAWRRKDWRRGEFAGERADRETVHKARQAAFDKIKGA